MKQHHTFGTTIHDETVEIVETSKGWKLEIDGERVGEPDTFSEIVASAIRFVPKHRRSVDAEKVIFDSYMEAASPRVLGSDAARAVGRFDENGPHGYRAATAPDAPLRATRDEAENDERAHLEAVS
jgi:hypothetical protein